MKYFYFLVVVFVAAATLFFIGEYSRKKCEARRLFVRDSISTAVKERIDSVFADAQSDRKNNFILICKGSFTLKVFRDTFELKKYMVALGKNPKDKERIGDNATPLGSFYIIRIEDSSFWTHDFKDGKGEIDGAYGQFFLRLKTGADETLSGKEWMGIGIHGTHDNSSLGTNASEGCVRMKNEDLVDLMRFVEIGTRVEIKE